MPAPNAVSVSQLYRLIGTPDCPAVLDVRLPEDFDDDPRIIPGAQNYAFDDVPRITEDLAGKKAIIYCKKGLKIAQGVAAMLRLSGAEATFLEGGQFAWRDAGLPMVTAQNIPKTAGAGHSLWVTRHRPKIDRIACPWLIRRFVDPMAEFLFVEPSQVQNVAECFGATPFDIEDTAFSHRGELCSFDTMLEMFELQSDPLSMLAKVIRGADTNRHDLAPEAAGLLAISVGLSRMYRHDLDQLGAGMLIYDALYRWARDASDEGHDWPAALPAPKSA